MSTVLPPVRFHDENSPYHYTEDNKPLNDLATRDEVLKNAIDVASEASRTTLVVGDWGSLVASLSLATDVGKPFALRLRLWAIQDQSISATQNATLTEDIITGFISVAGTITILSTFNNYKRQQGTSALTYAYVASGTNLNITFSGYVGTNGYILVRAERFGP